MYYQKMELKLYDRPSLFILLTDKVAFVEPYHYGERIVGPHPEGAPHLQRVAELVPLIEFEKGKDRGPYEQFLGHFEYVFERAHPPRNDE
jgi:hypothetical protein